MSKNKKEDGTEHISELDNITIFNKLTHDEDGTVDNIIFNKLMENFDEYLLFKQVLLKNDEGFIIKKAIKDNDNIKFKLEFSNTKVKNKFIKMNEDTVIKFKKKEYSPILTKVKGNIVHLYFTTL